MGPKKTTLVSGNATDEKNIHPGSGKFIFLNQFSRDILFSSLSFSIFVFLFFCFFFVCLFFEIKNIYSDIHPTLRAGEYKEIFIWLISGNKATFFGMGINISCHFFEQLYMLFYAIAEVMMQEFYFISPSSLCHWIFFPSLVILS